MSYAAKPGFYWSMFSWGRSDGYLPPAARAEALESVRRLRADAAVQSMIQQYEELYQLRKADVVVPLIEEWRYLEAMGATEKKQLLLESLLPRVQREPAAHEGELIFVLLTLEPIRRSICRRLLQGCPLGRNEPEPARHRRQEARWLRDLQRQEFFDATRAITLELVHGYRFNVALGRIFGWFRETLSWRVLKLYEREYLTENRSLTALERRRLARFLHGLDALEPPETEPSAGYRRWRRMLGDMRPIFVSVEEYRARPEVQRACREAVDRLSPRRRDTILAYYYRGMGLEQIARRDGVAVSTVGNTKIAAEACLRGDDLFYCALDSLHLIRNDARREEIALKHPDGRLPDGKRLVWVAEDPVTHSTVHRRRRLAR